MLITCSASLASRAGLTRNHKVPGQRDVIGLGDGPGMTNRLVVAMQYIRVKIGAVGPGDGADLGIDAYFCE